MPIWGNRWNSGMMSGHWFRLGRPGGRQGKSCRILTAATRIVHMLWRYITLDWREDKWSSRLKMNYRYRRRPMGVPRLIPFQDDEQRHKSMMESIFQWCQRRAGGRRPEGLWAE